MGSARATVADRVGAAALLLLLAAAPAGASDVPAARARPIGHPRSRLPLAVYLEGGHDPTLEATVRRAVSDWNEVFRDALGPTAFTWTAREADAAVVVRLTADAPERLFGETWLDADEQGVIRLPIRIRLSEPVTRGQTPPAVFLYQVAAHELGHALGLPHDNAPGSLMCCDPGTLNFDDPAVRAAYVQARRQPDLRSVVPQLVAHYRQFWNP